TSQAINVDRAAVDGAELSHHWHAAAWTVDSSLTIQNPRNQDSGSQLLRRPKQKLESTVERGFGERLRAGAEVVVSGKRDDVGNVTLPGYALVNLRATYALGTAWRVGLRLENVLDRNYELAHGYNTPGSAGFVEIAWQPR